MTEVLQMIKTVCRLTHQHLGKNPELKSITYLRNLKHWAWEYHPHTCNLSAPLLLLVLGNHLIEDNVQEIS